MKARTLFIVFNMALLLSCRSRQQPPYSRNPHEGARVESHAIAGVAVAPLPQNVIDGLDEIDGDIHGVLFGLAWERGFQRLSGDDGDTISKESRLREKRFQDELVALRAQRRQILIANSLPADRCEIHHELLVPAEVPILYGLLAVPRNERERKLIYRNWWRFVPGGCVGADDVATSVEILICPTCRQIAERWK